MATDNREVQRNEDAQVYVHDLDLFVTVQILDDTLAVLSLGKFCEEHGSSYEWASGQKPHLAPVRHLHRYSRTHEEHLQVQQSCEGDDEALGNRRDRQKKLKTKKKEGGSGKPLVRLPNVVSFRTSQNLEDTEVPAIGHISQDSDSERPTKVASKMHTVLLTFRKTKLRSLLANQNDKGSLQVGPDILVTC